MTINELKQLQESGEFHHATYRDFGTLWEGLWIYRKSSTGFRGYAPAGRFAPNTPELEEAEKLCLGTHVGAFGKG